MKKLTNLLMVCLIGFSISAGASETESKCEGIVHSQDVKATPTAVIKKCNGDKECISKAKNI